MSTVDITYQVPQSEKDAIDAIFNVYKILKSSQGPTGLLAMLPQFISLAGELQQLGADLKSKGSVGGLMYIEQQAAAIFLP